MAPDGVLATLLAVARALDQAAAPYFVGGSFASSLQGIPRSTQDVGLVVNLDESQALRFVDALGEAFYADRERILDGVRRHASFNVIDLRTGFKVDVYVPPPDPFLESQFARRQSIEVIDGRSLPFASPEDVVLQKLRWFRLGAEVSERQWLDALGVLEVQGDRLDRPYLARWAGEVGVLDLLERALDAGGLASPGAV